MKAKNAIELLNEEIEHDEKQIKSVQQNFKDNIKLELSELNEVKSQEEQRWEELRQRRGELVVRAE